MASESGDLSDCGEFFEGKLVLNMFKSLVSISSAVLLFLPFTGFSQIHERGMMRNRNNVAVESSNYTIGIIKDTTKFQESFIQFLNNGIEDEIAAESEEDILYASFDTRSIHYVGRFDYSNLTEAIPIELVNEDAKQYFACPVEGRITSHFGPRRSRWHYGTDIGLRTGTPIKSMFDGKVRIAKRAGAYGNLVVIRHDNGLETYYAHLSKINVKPNQDIKAGEIAAINPEKVINFADFSLKDETLMLTKDYFRKISSPSSSRVNLAKNSTSAKASKGGTYYKVKRGDTLSTIARRNGTTVKKLAKLNNIKGTKIRAGQRLRLR